MRKPLPKKLRFEVLKRDGFACQYCGQGAPHVVLHVGHVIPVSRGGTNDMDNLVAACEDCNSGKRASFHDPMLAQVVDLKAKVIELEGHLATLSTQWHNARYQAYRTVERLVNSYGIKCSEAVFEDLVTLVWYVGPESANDAFACGEYDIGSEPEALLAYVMQALRKEKTELEDCE